MSRTFIALLGLLTCVGLILAADDVTGAWEGSFQTQDGVFGSLSAQVSEQPDGTYKAVVSAHDQGIQFELPGKKSAEKIVFDGSINVSPEAGPMEIHGEITGGKFSGTFKGSAYSGTFEMKRPEKKPAD